MPIPQGVTLPRRPPLSRFLPGFVLVVLAATLATLFPAGADAATRTIKPVDRTSKHVIFRIDVAPARIVRADLKVGKRRQRLSVKRVRAAAAAGGKRLLRQPLPRTAFRAGARAATVRLVLTLRGAGDTPATRTTSGCGDDLSSFGPGRWPSACWRPYSDASPFNQRIGSGAQVDARSSAFVRELASWGKGPSDLETGTADTDSDWQHPTYYSDTSDPEFTIHCVGEYGVDCEIEGMKIRIPDPARQGGSYKRGWEGDGHMTVVEKHTGWEYDFWNVRNKPRGGGRIDVGWGGRTRIDGDGLGSNGTAAWYGNLAGIIRAQEMQAGRINHALFMVIKCSAKEWVYPAQEHGSLCDDQSDAIPFGTRFQLDMTPQQIEALDVPAWKKTILKAMAEYGMYVGDTGGSPWDLQFESGSTYTSFGFEDEMVAFGREQGLEPWRGVTYWDLKSGVDWSEHLRVIAPCEAQRTC